MTTSVFFPMTHVEDANGIPYVGARQIVYESNTTQLRPVFSDSALTIPAANPQISNAAGNFPRVFTAPGTYKIRLEQRIIAPATSGVLIAEYDEIDTGLSAGVGALPIVNGGTGATTASAALANLGGAAASELTALSVQIAALSTSLTNLTSIPQGRLTLTSMTPVLSSGVTAGTSIYYTPYLGNLCPIWNGGSFDLKIIPELSMALNSNHLANALYDLFVINDSNTIRLVTGPAWNVATAGLGARGSGAGTTELTRTNGLYTNANPMTARYGATTVSVLANQGTYVGSLFVDGTAGQASCLLAYGQSRKWSIWNAYNRVPIVLKAGDATASWAYNTINTPRASNNSTANSSSVFCGLPEEIIDLRFVQKMQANTNAANSPADLRNGIGWNVTNAFSGKNGNVYCPLNVNNAGLAADGVAAFAQAPFIGVGIATAVENTVNAGATPATYFGTEANMLLSAEWRG